MEARFVHNGDAIDYVPNADVSAGTVVVMGDRVGLTKFDIAANTLGSLAMVGVFDFAKDNTVIPIFGKVYWDATAKKATLTANGNNLIGLAVQEAIATDTIVRVRLN